MGSHIDTVATGGKYDGAFGVLALTLALVGVYGVIACTVSQRSREFGVRLALGATARGLLGLVLRQGLWLTSVGVGAGLAAAMM